MIHLRRRSLIAVAALVGAVMGAPAVLGDSGPPTGEHFVGNNVSIEPAYNAETGTLLYLSTPIKSRTVLTYSSRVSRL